MFGYLATNNESDFVSKKNRRDARRLEGDEDKWINNNNKCWRDLYIIHYTQYKNSYQVGMADLIQ